MTIWITGAGGFIGGHLAAALANSDRLCGIGHGEAPAGMRFVPGNLDAFGLDQMEAMTGTPDTVFHLAGGASVGESLADPAGDFSRTVPPTAALLEWLRHRAPDAAIVAVSSAAVYGAGHSGPISEDGVLDPQSPYAFHKRSVELLCQSYARSFGLRVVIVRPFSVYGDGLRKQLLWDLCRRCAAGEDPVTLQGTGEELRDWTDVRDVVRAIVLCADQASHHVPVINLGTGRALSVRHTASILIDAWGSAADLQFSGICRLGDPLCLVADPARLRDRGFAWTIEAEIGIRDYVAWFRRQA